MIGVPDSRRDTAATPISAKATRASAHSISSTMPGRGRARRRPDEVTARRGLGRSVLGRDRRSPAMTRVLASADAWQRRHPLGGFPLAVLKKFGEDRASSLAALVAYYAFFSLFPLLLAFVSILGFVLDDNPELRRDVVDSALARIPVIGAELRGDVQPLTGSGIALAVGLAGALWAGLGVTLALGRAFAEIWDTPRARATRRAQGAGARTRAPGGPRSDARRLDGRGRARRRRRDRPGGRARRRRCRLARRQRRRVARRLRAPDPAAAADPRRCCPASRWRRSARSRSSRWAAGTSTTRSSDASAIYGTFAVVIGLLSWFWLVAHLLLSRPRSTSCCAGACGRAR